MKLRDVKKELAKFRGMDEGALQEELTKLKKEQFNLRFQAATGQLEKTSRVGEVREQIARVRTVMAQKAPKATV